MKKVIMTMMAALFISSAAFAQENKEQDKCCEKKCEQCKCCEKKCGNKKGCDKKFDKKFDKKDFVKMQTEMTVKRNKKGCDKKFDKKFDKKDFVKMQTEMTVKRYNLDEKQAAKLLDLNQKYADMRKNYETDLQKIMTPEQFEQYKADCQKHGMRGHHGKGGPHHKDGHHPHKDCKE